jgi:hypothetical protein
MAETYTGEVRNGVFEAGIQPPEGTKVQVEPIGESGEATDTLADRLRSVIGIVNGLPADLAEQHDHYIHGTPKR